LYEPEEIGVEVNYSLVFCLEFISWICVRNSKAWKVVVSSETFKTSQQERLKLSRTQQSDLPYRPATPAETTQSTEKVSSVGDRTGTGIDQPADCA
jgi:hypothetical protein